VPSTKITPVSARRDLPLRPRRRGAVIAGVEVAYANVICGRSVGRDARAPLVLPVPEEIKVDGRARQRGARVDPQRHVGLPEVVVADAVVDVSAPAAGVAVAVPAARAGRPVARAGAGVSDMVGPVRRASSDVIPQLLLAPGRRRSGTGTAPRGTAPRSPTPRPAPAPHGTPSTSAAVRPATSCKDRPGMQQGSSGASILVECRIKDWLTTSLQEAVSICMAVVTINSF
jgi:hypothetical protein